MATTEEKLLKPASIYAINKRDHEEMFLAVGMALQIPTVALRLFNAYGSRQALSNPYTGVAAIFISRLQNDQPPLVFEDGLQQRDFVHVQDVADAFVAALESEKPSRTSSTSVAALRSPSPRWRTRWRGCSQRHRAAISRQVPGRRHSSLLPGPDKDRKRRSASGRSARSRTGMQELITWVAETKKPVDRTQASVAELEKQKATRLGTVASR